MKITCNDLSIANRKEAVGCQLVPRHDSDDVLQTGFSKRPSHPRKARIQRQYTGCFKNIVPHLGGCRG